MNGRSAANVSSDPVTASLNQPVRIPSTLRVAVAVAIVSCGVVFAIVGAMIGLSMTGHPVGATVVTAGSAFVACLLSRVAYEVLTARPSRYYAVSPWIYRAFGALFGVAAIGMFLQAWSHDSLVLAAKACGVGFFAFLIVRSTVRR